MLYEVPIDDGDLSGDKEGVRDACISWRGDSAIFVVNYGVGTGRKCLTRDV